jgi:hypothetical protein
MDVSPPSVADVVLLITPGERELPWEREAPTRHALRRYLLALKWTRSWHRADLKAAALVALARAERKVRLPTGWDSESDLAAWLPDTECPICGKFFRARFYGQQYCGSLCGRRGTEMELFSIARAGAIGPPRCQWCRAYMEVDYPGQLHCNSTCMGRAKSLKAVERADAELGAKIKAARFARGLTQRQLARMVGVDLSYIKHIEPGSQPGSQDLREQILNILELDPDASVQVTERLCLWCGEPTGSKRASVHYCCSNHQRLAARRAGLPERHCVDCGGPIDPAAHLLRKTCGPGRCLHKHNGQAHAISNGSDPRAHPNGAGGRERRPPDRAGAGAGAPRTAELAAAPAAPRG